MPATSDRQANFMGLVRAIQKGKVPTSKLKRVGKDAKRAASTMKPADVKDFTKKAFLLLDKLAEDSAILPFSVPTAPLPVPNLEGTESAEPSKSTSEAIVEAVKRRPKLLATILAAKIALGGALVGGATLLGIRATKKPSWQERLGLSS